MFAGRELFLLGSNAWHVLSLYFRHHLAKLHTVDAFLFFVVVAMASASQELLAGGTLQERPA